MRSLLIAVAVGALSLIGCSRSGGIPESKTLRNAPTQESHTGYLVLNAQESILAEMAEDNEHVYVRPINTRHGLYEVHGTTRAYLQEALGAKALVHHNKYMLGRQPSASPQKDCFSVNLVSNLDKYEISHIYELGETVSVEINNHQLSTDIEYSLKPPKGSALPTTSGKNLNFNFNPDISGEYSLFVGSRSNKSCPVLRKSIYVTANPKLDPNAKLSAKAKAEIELKGFWHIESLGLENIWKTSTGKGTLIAIIDTGVNYNHEALNQNIYINHAEIADNGIDDDNNGFIDDHYGYDFASSDPYPFDDHGHGSHVSGLAAAATFGVAKDAKILAIKTQAGMGLDIGTFVGAIYYAVDQGADVINASFGWDDDFPIFYEAVKYANDNDVFIMAAAGNDAVDNDSQPNYPANYALENIISVAAVKENGVLTSYSNFGQNNVDIATLGGDQALTLFSANRLIPNPNKKYVGKAGTSMATPIMAGAMALAIAKNPRASASALKAALMKSSVYHPSLQGRVVSNGLLNLPGLLSRLQ